MVVRRYSYLGRQKIMQQHIAFALREDKGNLIASCRMDLASYNLPADAKVYIESYRLETYMRFDVGTVSQLQIPNSLELTDFEYVDGIKFRIKVVGFDGVLLAEADKIQAGDEELPENRLPLITPVPRDLGELVYEVDLNHEPLLVVNSNYGDWRELATNPFFKSVVFPAVVREILTHVLIIQDHTETTDMDDWKSQWLKFGTLLPGVLPLKIKMSVEDKSEWIDSVVNSFSRRFKSFTSMQGYLSK